MGPESGAFKRYYQVLRLLIMADDELAAIRAQRMAELRKMQAGAGRHDEAPKGGADSSSAADMEK